MDLNDAHATLLRDSIELANGRLTWPVTLEDKRKTAASLVNTQPLRSFTPRSAHLLALELATQDHPEKHLCPYLRSSTSAIEKRKVDITSPSDLPKRNHATSSDPGNPDSQEIAGGTLSAKPRDPKSLSQALIDTKAFKEFYTVSEHRYTPQASVDRSCLSNNARLEVRPRQAPVNGNHFMVVEKRTEQLEQLDAEDQSSTRRSIRRDGEGGDTLRHNHCSTVNQLRPQTLLHFSKENVKALLLVVKSSHDAPPQDQHTQGSGSTTAADGATAKTSPTTSTVNTCLYQFFHQSLVHVLSSLPALSASFTHEVIREGDLLNVSDSFSDMVQTFSWLQKLEGYPPVILPSLLRAADMFHASLLAIEQPRDKTDTSRQPSNYDGPLKVVQKSSLDIESLHLASIIFAALVAVIPPCTKQVWSGVHKCHNAGVKLWGKDETPATIRSLESVLDAFENSMALDLLAKLVHIFSSSVLVISMTQKEALKNGPPDAYHRILEPVVQWILGNLREEGVVMTACSNDKAKLHWRYDLPSLEQNETDGLPYPCVMIEWLKVLVMKRWDGRADVPLSSTAGNALEVLGRFHMPAITAWPDHATRASHKHLLQYPFIFTWDHKVRHFRAINYSKMSNAHTASVVASRLLAQTTFGDRTQPRFGELERVVTSYFVIEIRRQSVLVDAFNQLWRRPQQELLKPLKVRMGMDEGEEGVDHGGVQQEFFRVAIAEVLKTDYGKKNAHRLWHHSIKKY
ncbi:MAG: hypothetical protein Q9169_000757 [Polycauliona sp. 2 TL-2023]